MSVSLLNTDNRPKEACIYIIRSAVNPSITLYVGSASHLGFNLLPTHHHIIRHCRRELIDASLDYEVEPDPNKRKKREYQLISELNPVFNMGALPLESASPDSGWRSDTHFLALQLMDAEGNGSTDSASNGSNNGASDQSEAANVSTTSNGAEATDRTTSNGSEHKESDQSEGSNSTTSESASNSSENGKSSQSEGSTESGEDEVVKHEYLPDEYIQIEDQNHR